MALFDELYEDFSDTELQGFQPTKLAAHKEAKEGTRASSKAIILAELAQIEDAISKHSTRTNEGRKAFIRRNADGPGYINKSYFELQSLKDYAERLRTEYEALFGESVPKQ